MFKGMWNPTNFIENIDPFGGSDSKESICSQETWVQSLGREDSLEKGMTTHSNILAWWIPWTEEPGRLQSMVVKSWTRLSDYHLHFSLDPLIMLFHNSKTVVEITKLKWAMEMVFRFDIIGYH